jgi:cupin 2 domain-containing protein
MNCASRASVSEVTVVPANLFAHIPPHLPDELLETLCQEEHLRIERIVSRGHASPADFWYDQEQHEFVLLVSGSARVTFADGNRSVELAPGDWLDIKAHVRHRVEWTDPAQDTIWLAVHYR